MDSLTLLGRTITLVLLTIWRSLRFVCVVFACPLWVTFMLLEFLFIKDPCLWREYSNAIDIALEKEVLEYWDTDFYVSNVWIIGSLSIIINMLIYFNN